MAITFLGKPYTYLKRETFKAHIRYNVHWSEEKAATKFRSLCLSGKGGLYWYVWYLVQQGTGGFLVPCSVAYDTFSAKSSEQFAWASFETRLYCCFPEWVAFSHLTIWLVFIWSIRRWWDSIWPQHFSWMGLFRHSWVVNYFSLGLWMHSWQAFSFP